MSHFKNEPNTSQDILEQSLWLNNNIKINNKIIYWKSWTNAGIMYINDIIKQHNGIFLTRRITMQIQYKNKLYEHITNPIYYTKRMD